MGKVITIDLEYVLWLFGFIASAWGVVKIIKEVKKPNDDLKAKVQRHDELLNKDNERLNSLEKITLNQEGINRKLEEHTRILSDHDDRLDEDKERSNLLLKANIAILNGLLSESDKEKLVETRNEIQDFLVEKNQEERNMEEKEVKFEELSEEAQSELSNGKEEGEE